ncbi:aldo/keto reductase [uncultured Shewanella sp.]|uniref:aldo/keto reductase n=1 Tax=uncultured Shewanella sp. TaxID=173975 RepID=UPI002623ECC8|nr:aldo/keto reductase [uncultured Shewanella sp.]
MTTKLERVLKTPMQSNGLNLSHFVQGYWRLDEWGLSAQECLSFIQSHLALGISSVDHAHVYGNPSCEQLFGQALRLKKGLRDELEIISKCGIVPSQGDSIGHYNFSQKVIFSQVENSLRLLGTDHLDVLLLHRPDYLMDADEVANAFSLLRQQGKVKHFGVSNFTAAQFLLLQSRLDFPLVTNQIEMNPLNLSIFESGILEELQRVACRPMAWSCLAGGEVFNLDNPQSVRVKAVLETLVEELNADSIEQVIYAWIMRHPSDPLPILGSGNIARTALAVASQSLSLNHEQWYRVWCASKGQPVP